MASALKAQFEAEAAKQKASPAKPGQPTGVQGLIKQHKNFIEPPPAKGKGASSHQRRSGPDNTFYVMVVVQ
jgi:hypothetical protein